MSCIGLNIVDNLSKILCLCFTYVGRVPIFSVKYSCASLAFVQRLQILCCRYFVYIYLTLVKRFLILCGKIFVDVFNWLNNYPQCIKNTFYVFEMGLHILSIQIITITCSVLKIFCMCHDLERLLQGTKFFLS